MAWWGMGVTTVTTPTVTQVTTPATATPSANPQRQADTGQGSSAATPSATAAAAYGSTTVTAATAATAVQQAVEDVQTVRNVEEEPSDSTIGSSTAYSATDNIQYKPPEEEAAPFTANAQQVQDVGLQEVGNGPHFNPNYPQCANGIVMNSVDGTIYCAWNEDQASKFKLRQAYYSPVYNAASHVRYMDNRYKSQGAVVVGRGTPYNVHRDDVETETSPDVEGATTQVTDEQNRASADAARAAEMLQESDLSSPSSEDVAATEDITQDVNETIGYETDEKGEIRCRYGVIEYQGQQYCAYSEEEYTNYTKKTGPWQPGASSGLPGYFSVRGTKGALPAGRSDLPPPQPPQPPEPDPEPELGNLLEDMGFQSAEEQAGLMSMSDVVSVIDTLMSSEAMQFEKVAMLQRSWDMLPAELKASMAQRSAEVRRLRELRDLDPCAEINPDPLPNENPELEDEAPETGDPPTPPEGGEDERFLDDIPFLVPSKTITTEIASADREVTVINRHLFDDNQYVPLGARRRPHTYPDIAIPLETKKVLQTDSSTSDPLRYTSGKFWGFNSVTNKLTFVNKSRNIVKMADGLASPYSFAGPGRGEIVETYSPSEHAYTSTYNLIFPKNQFPGYFNRKRVAAFMLGERSPTFGRLDRYEQVHFKEALLPPQLTGMVDTVFSAEQPFFESEMDNMRVSQFTSAKINAVVTTRKDPNVNELQLPNLYSAYHKVKNVNKLLENMFQRQINATTVEEANRIAQEIESIVSDPNQLYTKINCDATNRIYKFPCQQVIEMQEANNSSFRGYGNYVEISINTQQGSFISSILHETGMDLHVLEYLTSTNIVKVAYAEYMSEAVVSALDPVSSQLSESGFSEDANVDMDAVTRIRSDLNQAWSPSILERTTRNLEDFFKKLSRIPLSFYANTLTSRSEQYPLSYDHSDNPGLRKFIDGIKSVLFTNRLYNFLGQDHIRSFSDILAGRKCYSETIGYRVSKHIMVGNDIIEEPIQQFYFMDSDQIRDFKFIDTQVRSGTKYIYRVRSLNFVIGSVSATGLRGRPDNESTIMTEGAQEILVPMKTVTTPTLRIIEAPFFERIISVVPRPPVPPQASFLPYQGVDDRMQILIQTSFGEVKQKPIAILGEDVPALERMVTAQDPDSEGRITYKNDSMPVQFQIFRLSTPPSSYADFGGSNYIKEVVPNSTSFLFLEENIEPNRDYYYMFREYDGDGISNPSQVYRVRMVSYPNGIYMDLDVYDMSTGQEEKMEISFGDALQISPSVSQSRIDFSSNSIDSREFALSAPDTIDLGPNGTNSPGTAPVWGRKFKARIISKTSGKKIDINFKFVKKITKYERAEQSQAEQAIENPPACE